MTLRFRTSSYSSSQENCVEVATLPTFRTSSYSDSHENCVEVAEISPRFRTSSYSTSDDNCVEVALPPAGAAVRDSKHPEAGHLAFAAREWAVFLAELRGGRA